MAPPSSNSSGSRHGGGGGHHQHQQQHYPQHHAQGQGQGQQGGGGGIGQQQQHHHSQGQQQQQQQHGPPQSHHQQQQQQHAHHAQQQHHQTSISSSASAHHHHPHHQQQQRDHQQHHQAQQQQHQQSAAQQQQQQQRASSTAAASSSSQSQQASDGIIDVYANNLEEELENIRHAIELFPFVAMDTEFPGVVARPIGNFKSSSDYHYQTLRCNVDLLRIIQLGITLCDGQGNLAEPISTWQFNFRFSLSEDMYAPESIELLTKSGINFKKHEEVGIDVESFGELLISSGLVLLDDVKWISFHSGYDFGYLLKLVSCASLPPNEVEFFELLKIWFPCIYDIKFLMRSCKSLKGGLQDVADELQVARIGPQHQAGSDSLLTASTFFKMRSRFFEDEIDPKYLGSLYGLGSSSSSFHTTGAQGGSGAHANSTPQMQHAHTPLSAPSSASLLGMGVEPGPPIPPVASAALQIKPNPFTGSPFKQAAGGSLLKQQQQAQAQAQAQQQEPSNSVLMDGASPVVKSSLGLST